MRVQRRRILAGFAVVALAAAAGACGSDSGAVSAASKPEPLSITAAPVESRPIDRYLRVTGSLLADEQADLSAEATGRIVATPVERGTRVAQGAIVARVSSALHTAALSP